MRRRDTGEAVGAVSSFLDHASLAVTSVYARPLEDQTERVWAEVAAIGV